MATGVQVWSQTPASNATSDSNINWAEGMAPSQVNDSARAMMSSVAKWNNDNNGTLTTSGSSSALTVNTNQVEGALTTGYTVAAILGTSIAGSATLAVDGLVATNIYTALSTASQVSTGQYTTGQFCSFLYSTAVGTGGWIIRNAAAASSVFVGPTFYSNSLGADVNMTAGSGTTYAGPTITTTYAPSSAQTWLLSGTVTHLNTSSGGTIVNFKLWDGTTVVDSCSNAPSAANTGMIAALSGIITTTSTSFLISANSVGTAPVMKANASGYSKDSTITALRIA